MKIISLFLSIAVSPVAFADQYTDLVAKYYQNQKTISPDVGDKAAEISAKIASMDVSGVNVPAATYSWVDAEMAAQVKSAGFAFMATSQLPLNLAYEKGPPSKWVGFLSGKLANPGDFHCTSGRCEEAERKGSILDPILQGVLFNAADDKTLAPADKQKLRDMIFPFYKDLTLKTDVSEWQLSPGNMLQAGCALGDSRAAQKALDMVKSYLEGSQDPPAGENFQQAMFALETYYESQKKEGNTQSELFTQTVGSLRQILSSDVISDRTKQKLRNELAKSGSGSPGSGVLPSDIGSHGQK